MKDFCACVATSEKTLHRARQLALRPVFFRGKSEFDLVVVHNGPLSEEARAFLTGLPLDHLMVRENLGNEGGSFDHAIKTLPAYAHYLLMHDDHWVWDERWAEKIVAEVAQKPRVCLGNIVLRDFQWSEDCNELLEPWHFSLKPGGYRFPTIQGMAGVFPRSAIEVFLKHGGIPFGDYSREPGLTHFFEMVFSLMLINYGFSFESLPGGFEYLLLHRVYALSGDNPGADQRLPAEVREYLVRLHQSEGM